MKAYEEMTLEEKREASAYANRHRAELLTINEQYRKGLLTDNELVESIVAIVYGS